MNLDTLDQFKKECIRFFMRKTILTSNPLTEKYLKKALRFTQCKDCYQCHFSYKADDVWVSYYFTELTSNRWTISIYNSHRSDKPDKLWYDTIDEACEQLEFN